MYRSFRLSFILPSRVGVAVLRFGILHVLGVQWSPVSLPVVQAVAGEVASYSMKVAQVRIGCSWSGMRSIGPFPSTCDPSCRCIYLREVQSMMVSALTFILAAFPALAQLASHLPVEVC